MWRKASKAVRQVAHRKSYHHAHNVAYCVYYAFAIAEDRGFKLVVVSIIFACSLLAALAASEH
jgi:hypothetical protein